MARSVLWLRPDTGPGSLDVLAQAAVPLLVVVDYAETRTAQLAALLEAAFRHTGSTPVKLLLVARTAGDWWRQLQAQSALAEELLDGAPTIDLPPLEPDPGHSRTTAYREAIHAYAGQLPHVTDLQHHDWPATATRLTHTSAAAPERGHAPRAEDQSPQTTALTLHMSALADLLDIASHQDQDPADPAKAQGDSAVEDRLLKHEERYWSTSSTQLRTTLTLATLTDALAAVFLAGADTTGEADDLLARLPALKDQSRDRRDAVRDWITALYPPTTPGRPWDTLQPDRLTERFIGRRLLTHPDLAHQVIPGGSQRQATQVLTVYTRAAAQPAFQHQLDAHLTTLCIQHADTLVVPAMEVTTQTAEPQPLLDALNEITNAPDASLASLEQWADQLPSASRNLAPWAARLTQLIANLQRERSNQDPQQRPDLAMSLNNLAIRLGHLGRQEEALEAITEAVQIRRELANTRPVIHQGALEQSLAVLSRLRQEATVRARGDV
ncbi:tetratricopeptide repeat protein [Streptomyces doebereineriae]|uniref:Tetratricopeptide repeat protein n=1 Tax=Streptomyces doebereineriae TaxID=3075528 RepID=A0ABU2VGC8_9ACTN|nr:tetratricopeptide repeat protein [Streptomyces sp. DSM 41640]MDT0484642.1 tetratricopeptide repeat protein [Streptomyces sp. DSM 41640]